MKNLFPALTAMAVAGATLLSAVPASQAYPRTGTQDKFIFSCEIRNNQYVTVPQLVRDRFNVRYPILTQRRVIREYAPLLAWTTTLASDHPDGVYMPEGRCQAVSARLTNLGSSMGINSIQELSKVGLVNHQHVIFLSESPWASRDEVIFTLKPANRGDAPQILNSFRIGISGDIPAGIGGPSLGQISLPIYE